MQKVSVLVLGTGWWGSEWLRAISSVAGVDVAGTAGHDSKLPTGVELAPDHRHFTDYREAIDKSDADAVIVVLPAGLHADAARRAIEAGMHVLCEKPVAPSAAEVASLLATSGARSDRVMMVNQNYRWRPWARFVQSKIADGTIGTVAHVDVRFSQPELLTGGRAELEYPLLQDMSIHHFDLLRYLTGRNAVELFAQAHRAPWSEYSGSPGVDAVITMQDDIRVSYSGTWAGRGGTTTWDGDWSIQGDRGLLTVIDGRVSFRPYSGREELAPTGHSMTEASVLDIPDLPRGDLQSSLENFRMAIVLGEEPETSIWDNCHSIAMVFAAEDSIRESRTVPVRTWDN